MKYYLDCKETNYIFAVQFKRDVNCIFDKLEHFLQL